MLTILVYYTSHLIHSSGITDRLPRGRRFLFYPYDLWFLQILIRYKPGCCSRRLHVITASHHWHILADILVGVGKMLWSGPCSKNICGRPLWLALLLLLMHCTWAIKHAWKEAILVLKTDDLKLAFIQLWTREIPANVSKSCHQIFCGILPVTSSVFFHSFPSLHTLLWVSKWCRYKITYLNSNIFAFTFIKVTHAHSLKSQIARLIMINVNPLPNTSC